MKSPIIRDSINPDPRLINLSQKLEKFYATVDNYTAFQAPVDQSYWYCLFDSSLNELIHHKSPVKILEVGAGKTTFTNYLAGQRSKVEFHAQDITPLNYPYLSDIADKVWICDIEKITEQFDLVFSTFVLEHVATPSIFLEQIRNLIKPRGVHVVICPSYEVPGYICPSLRHMPFAKMLRAHTELLFQRMKSRFDGLPRFCINTDPAVLHQAWYRDADAVHCVSEIDVQNWHRRHHFSVKRLGLSGNFFHRLTRQMFTALECLKLPNSRLYH